MAAALLVALAVQFRLRKYVPAVFWLSIVLISIVGTLVSDNLTDNLGVPLWVTTSVFAAALALVFGIWWSRERTLSIHTIHTTPREAFYWVAVLVTFALGTSAGDLIAEQLKLGYLLSLVVFAAAIALVWALYRFAHLNAVAAFWIAYVLTRPLGASAGDLLSQPRSAGGVGFGTTGTSFLFLAVIVALVVFLSVTGHGAPRGRLHAAPRADAAFPRAELD
jgi:uncharacterized membrane-anchored protein